jgi:hypothetical protein
MMGMKKISFKGYQVSSGALDGNASTSQLKAGATYGHAVRTTQYFRLVPVDILVDSTLLDTRQLEFDQAAHSWNWQLHLDPFTVDQETVQVLTCRFPKVRFQDAITVKISGGDTGQLGLVLNIA